MTKTRDIDNALDPTTTFQYAIADTDVPLSILSAWTNYVNTPEITARSLNRYRKHPSSLIPNFAAYGNPGPAHLMPFNNGEMKTLLRGLGCA